MQRIQRDILEDILETITASESPDKSLDRIVRIIAERFNTDVCSVYVYNPYGNNLVLKATVGLNKESVGVIEMDVNEGLTGMVIETMTPVFIVNPSSHSRYKYYAESGEEVYKTYLGVPLIYHKRILGALVVQTLAEEGIKEADIPLFKTIAGQIAATVAYTILQEDRLRMTTAEPPELTEKAADSEKPDLKQNYLRGEPVSDRVAYGYAHYMFETIDFDQIHSIKVTDTRSEIKRLERAFDNASVQIQQVSKQARGNIRPGKGDYRRPPYVPFGQFFAKKKSPPK